MINDVTNIINSLNIIQIEYVYHYLYRKGKVFYRLICKSLCEPILYVKLNFEQQFNGE